MDCDCLEFMKVKSKKGLQKQLGIEITQGELPQKQTKTGMLRNL